MNEHCLELLGFKEIRARVASLCLSEETRAVLEVTQPSNDVKQVTQWQEGVGQLLAVLRAGAAPSLSFPELKNFLPYLHKENFSLNLDELYALGLWLDSYLRFKKYCGQAHSIDENIATIHRRIFSVIHHDGRLQEHAELVQIRRDIARNQNELALITQEYLSGEYKEFLQNEHATVRGERTVLALKANYKGRIKGLIHEYSNTGQTLFVEPQELLEKNNAILQLEAAYQRALAEILTQVTQAIAPHYPALEKSHADFITQDLLYARARYAYIYGGHFAQIRERGFLLKAARHPLLKTDEVVPLDIELTQGNNLIVISGPNAGGKTVSLKALGLLALMNQFGLAIPSENGSGLAIFDDVYIDSGDEQSIAAGLSSFSSHLKNIGAILESMSEQSLVLFDELGSSTDPEEGSALALAILEFCLSKQCVTLVTSHHSALKYFAYHTQGCVSASMEFDEATGRPKFRLLMGVPGASQALASARRTNIPRAIIERAETILLSKENKTDQILRTLLAREEELACKLLEVEAQLPALKLEKEKSKKLREYIVELEQELKQGKLQAFKDFSRDARSKLTQLIKQLREAGIELDKEILQASKNFISEMSEQEVGLAREIQSELTQLHEEKKRATNLHMANTELARDDEVRIFLHGKEQQGQILRKNKNGSYLVACGTMRVTVLATDIQRVKARASKVEYSLDTSTQNNNGNKLPSVEIDLRGYRREEALLATQAALDRAVLAGQPFLWILHGTGEGVLGPAIHDYLKKQASIKSYEYAAPEAGGAGRTLISFEL